MTDSNVKILSASVSDRGLSDKRPQNEDSFLELPQFGLFAVADGVGGAQAGDVASQMAVEILGEAFANLQNNGDAEDMMRLAIERANSAIFQMSSDLPQLSTMATTIVALYIDGQIATIGHVGDSRLYRLDAKGSLYRETQDHSVVEEEVRAGRMTAAQAANHPSRNVISRALGAEGSVEVDMKTIMFDANTTFLLCSDGITRHINDFEIRELLLSGAPPTELCAKMKEICYARGAEDNLTAVVVKSSEFIAGLSSATESTFDEEATIQTPRIASFEEAPEPEELPTRDLTVPAATVAEPPEDDDDQYLMDNAPDAPLESVERTPVIRLVEPTGESAPQTVSAAYEKERRSSYDDVPVSGSSWIGKAILFLLFGVALGAVGVYTLLPSANPQATPPPQLNEMQSSNPSLAAFENVRRELEASPEKLIANYEKTPPRDAADFYFLAKAFLYTKKYEDAKKNFIEARNKLGEYPEATNKAVLASDIALGLAVAEDKATQTVFEKERSFNNAAPAPAANTGK